MAGEATTRGRVTALVTDILEQNHKPRELGADERLVDAGMTSMDMVNLMLAVEGAFDIIIPPADITPGNFRSIASIESMVDRLVRQAA